MTTPSSVVHASLNASAATTQKCVVVKAASSSTRGCSQSRLVRGVRRQMNRVSGAAASGPRFRERRRSTKAIYVGVVFCRTAEERHRENPAHITGKQQQSKHLLRSPPGICNDLCRQTVVVKYGGAAMQSKELKAAVIRDICLMLLLGLTSCWYTEEDRR